MLFLSTLSPLWGLDNPRGFTFPTISNLNNNDVEFRQFQGDVEEGRKQVVQLEQIGSNLEKIMDSLTVYQYRAKKDEDLFDIAARCNVPYGTIATVNRVHASDTIEGGSLLLLPTIQGIFIPEQPQSDLERLLFSARADRQGVPVVLRGNKGTERFFFFPGEDFSPTERAFFLNTAFRYPLPAFHLTSGFGLRRNPVTGHLVFHEGLDLAAPEGTEVYACREGTVQELGYNAIYGNYVLLQHEGGWTSLYGHLSAVLTVLHKNLQSGSLLGRVGSTGQSTGPHLHFELRQNGKPLNPANVLPTRGIER